MQGEKKWYRPDGPVKVRILAECAACGASIAAGESHCGAEKCRAMIRLMDPAWRRAVFPYFEPEEGGSER